MWVVDGSRVRVRGAIVGSGIAYNWRRFTDEGV